MRILNSQAVNDSKRLRTSITNEPRLTAGSQQSEDSTLRHASQQSEPISAQQQQQALLLLRDTERASRLENKLDELIKEQKLMNERLLTVVDEMKADRTSSTLSCKAQNSSSAYATPRTVMAPPRTSLFLDSDSEEESIFATDLPASAEEMFSLARKARENRLTRQSNSKPTSFRVSQNLVSPEEIPEAKIRRSSSRLQNLDLLGDRHDAKARKSSSKRNSLREVRHVDVLEEIQTTKRDSSKRATNVAARENDKESGRTLHLLYTWTGSSIVPRNGMHEEVLADMVSFLSESSKQPKKAFKGLTLSYRKNGKGIHKRFTAPSGKFFYVKGRRALEAFGF